jgi:endonuclease-3
MARKSARPASLPEILGELALLYAFAAPPASAFKLILQENIGYLIDDARRETLLREFARRVGLDAARIARAPDELLFEIAQQGGMHPAARVERWRRIADIVLTECGGDLDAHLRTLPVARARKLLKQFPAIGDPGADKILLFCGLDLRPALDSNGLRVLARLGVIEATASYAASYKAAVARLADAFAGDRDQLVSAYMLLREHGRALCKRSAPLCPACPLDAACAHAPAPGLYASSQPRRPMLNRRPSRA